MRTTDRADDAALLRALSEALEAPPAHPSADESAAFHDLATRARLDRPSRRPAWIARSRTPWPSFALAVVIVVVGFAVVATVKRVPISDPLRSVVSSIGLPIESTELVQTRRAMSEVRDALRRDDAERLATTVEALHEHLAELDAHDRAIVEPEAHELLEAARHRDDASPGAAPEDLSPTTSAPPGSTHAGEVPEGEPGHPGPSPAPPSSPSTAAVGHDGGETSDQGHTVDP